MLVAESLGLSAGFGCLSPLPGYLESGSWRIGGFYGGCGVRDRFLRGCWRSVFCGFRAGIAEFDLSVWEVVPCVL